MSAEARARAPRIHVDEDRTTNGQRFWRQLASRMPAQGDARRILFNVSAPWSAIARERLAGRFVVLRVDGMYFDRLSPEFIAQFRFAPLRWFLRLCARVRWLRGTGAFFANLVNRNYGVFARMALASKIIYQSRFSAELYRRVFPRKPSAVILNGADWQGGVGSPLGGALRLLTVYDPWRPSKRIGDAVRFVEWARARGHAIDLVIAGYDETRRPIDLTAELAEIIRTSPNISTTPRFADVDGSVARGCHAYLSLTYRDACPNAVIESMAFGLPVVGVSSGGVTEIVGDAGVLVPEHTRETFFAPHRFETAYPSIDFVQLLAAALEVGANLEDYRTRVHRRFETDLDMTIAARRYELEASR